MRHVKNVRLDISKEPIVQPVLYLGQGDANATRLVATIYDNGNPLSLSGYSARLSIRSPRGNGYYEVTGTVSGNQATFDIDETYAAFEAGATEVAYVEVFQGNSLVTSTTRFRVVILESAEEVDPSPEYISKLDDVLEDAVERAVAGVTVPIATTTTPGKVKPDGVTITVDNDGTAHATGAVTIPPATTSTIGGVIADGTTITVDQNGTIHGASSYTLPPASTTTLGGVKPDGTSVTVDSDGTVHATGSATIPPATTSTLGGVIADGTTITVDSDGTIHGASTYTLPPASTTTLGGVIADGTTITVDSNGKIHGASTYTLPPATTSTLGGVKADGTTVTVDADGTLHGASSYTLPPATTSALGGVKPDGTTITVDSDGTIHGASSYTLPTMGVSTKGGAKLGSGLSISNDVLSADITGIKGNAESEYRTGNVNITAANIGAATLASPVFTGYPKAPTAEAGTSNTQIATTAFVTQAIDDMLGAIANGRY